MAIQLYLGVLLRLRKKKYLIGFMGRYIYTYEEFTVIKLVHAVSTNVKKYYKIKEVGTKNVII